MNNIEPKYLNIIKIIFYFNEITISIILKNLKNLKNKLTHRFYWKIIIYLG